MLEARMKAANLLWKWIRVCGWESIWPFHLVFRAGITQNMSGRAAPFGWAKWQQRTRHLATSWGFPVLRKWLRPREETQVVGSEERYALT